MDYVYDISDSLRSILRGSLSHVSSNARKITKLKYVMMRICWLYRSANTRRTAFSAEASRSGMVDTDCRTPVICCGEKTSVRPWCTCLFRTAIQIARPVVPPNTQISVIAPIVTAWLLLACFHCRQVPRHLCLSCFVITSGAIVSCAATRNPYPKPMPTSNHTVHVQCRLGNLAKSSSSPLLPAEGRHLLA